MAQRVSPARTRKVSGAVTYFLGAGDRQQDQQHRAADPRLPPAARTSTTYKMAANSHTSTFDGGEVPRPLLFIYLCYEPSYPLLPVAFALKLR